MKGKKLSWQVDGLVNKGIFTASVGHQAECWLIPVAKYQLLEVSEVAVKENEAAVSFRFQQGPLNDIGEAAVSLLHT